MIHFGETLRNKRLEKGLSVSDIANSTHMLVQQVEALEKEDFSKIAAPIYGRGFVKLYCEAIGIEDPKPFIDEFMDIFSGNKPPTIRMRETPSFSVPTDNSSFPSHKDPENEEEIIHHSKNNNDEEPILNQNDNQNAITTVEELPPIPKDLFEFSLESEATSNDSTVEHSSSINPIKDTDSSRPIQNTVSHRSQGPSRYAAPKPIEYSEEKTFVISPVVLRFSILILSAALLIWLIFSSISCLCDAGTTTTTHSKAETTAETTSLKSNTDKLDKDNSTDKTPQKRDPMKLAPLYID